MPASIVIVVGFFFFGLPTKEHKLLCTTHTIDSAWHQLLEEEEIKYKAKEEIYYCNYFNTPIAQYMLKPTKIMHMKKNRGEKSNL